MAQLDLILCPVDLSPRCDPVVDFAELCARRVGAGIDLLHVRRPDAIPVGIEPRATPLHAFSDTEEFQRMKRYLEDMEERGIRCRGRLESGKAEDKILEIAGCDSYDLIVMGTHGRKGISHLLMGSLTENIIRRAPCPVLSVRVSDDELDVAIPIRDPEAFAPFPFS